MHIIYTRLFQSRKLTIYDDWSTIKYFGECMVIIIYILDSDFVSRMQLIGTYLRLKIRIVWRGGGDF